MARMFSSLFKDLRALSISNIEYFQNGTSSTQAKFHQSFCMLYEHLDRGIQPAIAQIVPQLSKFDLSPDTQANGYRSLLKTVHKCCLHILQLSRYINVNRNSLFFRGAYYSKELEAYVTVLGQLRASLYYAQKLVAYMKDEGSLFADEDKLNDPVVERLMEEVEGLSQNCFYGRCLGFQFCDSMQRPLTTVAVAMASFSEGYQEKTNLMQLTTSIFNSGKYIMNPEMRAEQIVNVTRTANVEFCKAFWSITESDIMQAVPSLVCPSVQVNEVIHLKPETFEIPSADPSKPDEMVIITPPCAHTGPGSVKVRLLSYEPREGQKYRSTKMKSGQQLPMSNSLLIHCHGGGFVAQSSKSHGIYLRQWAKDLNIPILSIDYSLAPEHPFPRAAEECFFAYAWAIKNCERLGWTGESLCVAGDSAGGNLVISTALRAASYGIKVPDGIMAAYPVVLVRYTPSPSRILALMDPLLPVGIMMRCLAAYAGVSDAPMSPRCEDEPFEIIEADEVQNQEDLFTYQDKQGTKGDNLSSMTSSCHSIESLDSEGKQEQTSQNDIMSVDDRCHSIESLNSGESHEISSQHASVLEGITVNSEEDILLTDNSDNTAVKEFSNSGSETESHEEEFQIISPEEIHDNNEKYTENALPLSASENNVTQCSSNFDSYKNFNTGSNTAGDTSKDQKDVHFTITRENLTLNLPSHNLPKRNSFPTSPSCPEINENMRYGFSGTFTPVYSKQIHRQLSPLQLFRKLPIVKNPYMSPYLAPDDLLKSLPPVRLVACHLDPLLDDSVMFAKRLRSLGCEVDLHVIDDLPHGFLNFSTASKEARLASNVCMDKIRQILQHST